MIPTIRNLVGAVMPIVSSLVFGTYSDPTYTTPQTNFLPNQTVYLKVESDSDGNKIKEFSLLDSEKVKVRNLEVSISGENPYLYTSSFDSPNKEGVYYIDVKLDSGTGVVYSGQKNINVSISPGGNSSSTAIVNSSTLVNVNSNKYNNDNSNSDNVDTQVATADVYFATTNPESSSVAENKLLNILQSVKELLKKLDNSVTSIIGFSN